MIFSFISRTQQKTGQFQKMLGKNLNDESKVGGILCFRLQRLIYMEVAKVGGTVCICLLRSDEGKIHYRGLRIQ